VDAFHDQMMDFSHKWPVMQRTRRKCSVRRPAERDLETGAAAFQKIKCLGWQGRAGAGVACNHLSFWRYASTHASSNFATPVISPYPVTLSKPSSLLAAISPSPPGPSSLAEVATTPPLPRELRPSLPGAATAKRRPVRAKPGEVAGPANGWQLGRHKVPSSRAKSDAFAMKKFLHPDERN
jgi:hypothetical protein